MVKGSGMSARFALFEWERRISGLLPGSSIAWEDRYNIAPGCDVPVIVDEGNGIEVRVMRWGLVPAWSKSFDQPEFSPASCRSRTAPVNRFTREAFASRRCLVLMCGFYEWTVMMQGVKVVKQPYYITRSDDQPLVVAGVWERWGGCEEEGGCPPRESFALMTTDPGRAIARRHDQMPCILRPQDFGMWLDPRESDIRTVQRLLKPWNSDLLISWPVDRRIGSKKYDAPDCIERLPERN